MSTGAARCGPINPGVVLRQSRGISRSFLSTLFIAIYFFCHGPCPILPPLLNDAGREAASSFDDWSAVKNALSGHGLPEVPAEDPLASPHLR